MKFELDHNNINLILTLEAEENYIPNDRFITHSPQTIKSLSKKEITAYNLIIESTKNNVALTFYLSGVLLSSNEDEIIEELQNYIEDEAIFDQIETSFEELFSEIQNPKWAK
jgi:hypothetical protein